MVLRIVQMSFGLIVFIGIALMMIRKRANTELSLIWLILGIGAMILGIFPKINDVICSWLRIEYKPAFLIGMAFTVLVWIVFYISSELAMAQTKIRELAMQISLLNNEAASMRERNEANMEHEAQSQVENKNSMNK